MNTLLIGCLLSNNPVYSTPTLSRPLNKGRGRGGERRHNYLADE